MCRQHTKCPHQLANSHLKELTVGYVGRRHRRLHCRWNRQRRRRRRVDDTIRVRISVRRDADTNSYSLVDTPSSPALSVPAAVESTMLSSYVSDRQLLQMAISQLMWTFGVLSTHVRHTQPSDVSDSMGRHLVNSQGHWLIPIPNAMSMSLSELIELLLPIWSQLYYTRR